MPTDANSILTMANKFGLLTTAPELLDLWRQEIRMLRLALPLFALVLALAGAGERLPTLFEERFDKFKLGGGERPGLGRC